MNTAGFIEIRKIKLSYKKVKKCFNFENSATTNKMG